MHYFTFQYIYLVMKSFQTLPKLLNKGVIPWNSRKE